MPRLPSSPPRDAPVRIQDQAVRLPGRAGEMSRDTHTSLFWFFAGVLFVIAMFGVFYILPSIIHHYLP